MINIECTLKPDVFFHLLAERTYVVGRKQGEINFPDDQSISRTHAELVVDHPQGNLNEPLLTPVLVVTDLGSKFGTFVTEPNIKNKIAVSAREPIILSIGDKLRFGLQWNEYRINYTPFVVVTSGVKPTPDFKDKIWKLGGHFINEWTVYVTHVVMDNLTLTIKAVCALLAAKPIVTPAYVTDLVSSFETNKKQPDPKNFLPTVIEKGLSNIDDKTFHANPARTTLFAGKTFLFCSQKHMKKLLPAILAGGGNAKLIVDAKTANVQTDEYIIMGQPLDIAAAERDPSLKIVIETYKSAKKRFIGDSEIGLAAVYTSIDKHCNPRCSITSAVLPQLTTQTQSSSGSSSVIVQPTQDVDSQLSTTSNISRRVVNETTVKEETGDDDRVSPSPGHSTRGEKRPLTSSSPLSLAESSSSKKRPAVDILPERRSKRLKEISNKPTSQTSSTLSSSRSRTKFSNLFGMSDSEEDEPEPVVIPESQPNDEPDTVDDEQQSTVPESQPGMLNIVELQNLQSVMDSEELVSLRVRREDDVFLVPESPPDRSQAMVRNTGTDNILTVTESVMNAKTIPSSFSSGEASPPPSGSKTRLASRLRDKKTSSDGSSRKRQRQDDEDDTLSERTKKINLDELKLKTEDSDGQVINALPLIVRSLVNKNMLRRECSFMEISNETGKFPVKNFKTFKKVLPRFATVAGVSNRGANSHSPVLNVTIEEIQSKRPVVKLVHVDYTPGSSVRYIPDIPPLFENRNRPLRDVEVEIPQGFEELDEFLQPLVPPSTKRTTRQRQSVPAAVEEPTSRRRSSPRKKAPEPPRPARAPVMEVVEQEEDEDDMWSFNR